MLPASRTAAALRVAFDVWVEKDKIKCDDMGLRGRIWHPVSKLACDGEGTLRFQGYFALLYSYGISPYSHLDFVLLILVAFWKQSNFFTNSIVLFFFKCFIFFWEIKYMLFFLHLLSKQSLADEADRAHFESKLLRGAAKVVEHHVHKWHLFHLRCVDLKYCLFIAFFQL